MKLSPIGKRTIVKPIENAENKTASGIILTSVKEDEYSDIAVVVVSDKFAVGTKVLLPMYDFSKIEADKQTYFVLYTEDILGVLK